MQRVKIHIDTVNFDSKLLVGKNIPKDKQEPGKRLPFFYLWLKDHYLQKSADNFERTSWSFSDDPRKIRENPELRDRLLGNMPDIVGLGLYNWNKDILLDNAKWYRENNPDTIIIAGGPLAENTMEFFKENDVVDLVIVGPGIEIFKNVIDCVVEGRPTEDLQGLAYMKNKELVKNPSLPKQHQPLVINWAVNLRDEAKQIIDEYHRLYKRVIVSTYYFHGCPYSCSFCEQGLTLWSKINKRPIDYLYKEIDFICEMANNDADDKLMEIEFLDSNFGITEEYKDIMRYFLDTNKVHGNRVILGNQAFAKNNVDTVFEIHRMIRESTMPRSKSPWMGYIALQDTNPDVLKLNGRPPSKEWEKLEEFKKLTGGDRYKLNQVDLIIGLPGQSYESLSATLYDVFEHHLFGLAPPQFYTVLPNTPLTTDGMINFEVTDVWHRKFRDDGVETIDFDGKNYSESLYSQPYLTKSDTVNTHELMTAFYMFMFLAHARSHIRWLDTPLNYLKNYHGKTNKDFIKCFVKQFHPTNQHRLPKSFQDDIVCLTRWFSGTDKLFMRRDNDNLGYLMYETMGKYRFHHSYKDTSEMFHKVFVDTIGEDTDMLQKIMSWQDFITWYPGKIESTRITYNYDDIAEYKHEQYFLSKFTPKFKDTDRNTILHKYRNRTPTDVIPDIEWENVLPEQQKELKVKQRYARI